MKAKKNIQLVGKTFSYIEGCFLMGRFMCEFCGNAEEHPNNTELYIVVYFNFHIEFLERKYFSIKQVKLLVPFDSSIHFIVERLAFSPNLRWNSPNY